MMCLLAILLAPLAFAADTLRVGAHAADITPAKLPIFISGGFLAASAENISGTLHARAIALDDGKTRVVIAVVDSLMMPREWLDEIKDAASRRTGIPVDRMLISATHTHSAPPVMGALGTDNNPEYAAFAAPRIVEAIAGAVRNLEPAKVGWTVVDAPDLTHCRRWILRPDRMRKDPFGVLSVRAHMHPGYQNPDFEGPSGPVDPGVSLLSFQSKAGRPIALLANYSMHYVGAGRTVSPDYYGPFVENMQRLAGAQDGARPFVAIMSQGTSGDQHWMDYSRPRNDTTITKYAGAMAKIVYDAYRGISYRDTAAVAMAETKLRLRRRVASTERLDWARQLFSKMAGAPPRNQEEVYAREQILIAAEPERELKLQALRIGDLGITAIPDEVFAITGLKLKAQSPLRPTFNIELANGAEGYIPPPEQHALGGYTTWAARTAGLEVDAEPKIVESVLGLLERVSGKPRCAVADENNPYAAAVLRAKPLGYWRGADFAGPTAKNSVRNGNPAHYEGGVAFYLDGPFPQARAPHFAGGGMRVDLKAALSRYTVSLWFYNALPTDARPTTGTLFSSGAEHLVLKDRLVFESKSGAMQGNTPVAIRSWHHLAMVRNGGNVIVYLDGKREMTGTADAAAMQRLWIGGNRPESSFEGKIGEVAVFGRGLIEKDIARLLQP